MVYSSLRVMVAPTAEPISLDVARQHCRIDNNDDDNLLEMYLTAARVMAENYLGRVLMTQTLVSTLQRHPDPRPYSGDGSWLTYGLLFPTPQRRRHTIELARAPVQSVSSVILRDDIGADTTIDPSAYLVDLNLEPARLRLDWAAITALPNITWPLVHLQITFIAGYASIAAIPQPIINSILLTTAALYERRGDEAETEFPKAAHSLLDPYRIQFFGN